ncbi:DUF1479-domain-containing protein [Lyophyllum atratum]|nr:DUF1479-domain-containing protein [Lyophyllum atratum]
MTTSSETASRLPKGEGTISDIFTTLTGESAAELPRRFAELKKELWRDDMVQSWKEVLAELEGAVEEVATRGQDMIPRISYADIKNGLSESQIARVKKTGTIIVTGGVPKEEALAWKQSIRDYVAANKDRVRGFPADNIQVFELYNAPALVAARTHPALLTTQKALLGLWHASDAASFARIDLNTPMSYFDRLRIRQPGDAKFALGPHIDGGSLERWEDPGFRSVFGKILRSDPGKTWRDHDPFDVTPRLDAKQDLYNASNQCSIFRPWQGWTALSTTGPGEGTLRVLPMLSLATSYLMLRPFFRPRNPQSSSLKFSDWEPDTDGTAFPGSAMAKAQELNPTTHPHLELERTMVSVPKVEPGDQVYWHCDVVHAVEGKHGGKSDSSVFYIPAAPLTVSNASYLRDQRLNFLAGLPAPDFPGGEGESKFIGRVGLEGLRTLEARRLFGFKRVEGDTEFAKRVNEVLFPQ